MLNFVSDYKNLEDAAFNKKPKRIPMYEHIVSPAIMEKMLGVSFRDLIDGDYNDKKEYFKNYCMFFKEHGYDTVSFEQCVGPVMPGSGALGGHKQGVIQTMEDFEKYPWEEIEGFYFKEYSENFEALREVIPQGMKAAGGVGNGVFECVQEVVGYMSLCYIRIDNFELYEKLFSKVGEMLYKIWDKFLKLYGDIYCVCRFGDDLGFKNETLLDHDDIRKFIIPQYKRIVSLVHSYNKPFLLHSCGCIFDVMDDIISEAKIDAKHSNEDVIAPFGDWIDKYGKRIGNFGGIDTDVLCEGNAIDIKEYVSNIYNVISQKDGGVAIGSGNSIPDYVSIDRYALMIETIRKLRGE